jgi:MSHA biogenesis protein MshO
MIMVIVITGIIGGMVAVFLKAPIQQYMDVGRRADMTDIADTALRRIGRDLRLALPNSVSVTTSGGARNAGGCTGANMCFLEFLPTTGGGRYRAALTASGTGDILDFTLADTSFDVLGPAPLAPSGTQYVVVYNLGIPGSDAYAGSNRATYSGLNTATNIAISAMRFPFASPAARFQVITTPVSYVCDPVGGTLKRYSGYPIQTAQPSSVPIAGATSATLAKNVSSCSFSYSPSVVAQRSGLVTMNLGITESGETVTMYSATHVSNVP